MEEDGIQLHQKLLHSIYDGVIVSNTATMLVSLENRKKSDEAKSGE